MGTLQIFLFGGCRVSLLPDDSGGEHEIKLSPITQTLLIYLVLHRNRLHPREQLIEQFWAEMPVEQARGCLSTALWRLRRALDASKAVQPYLLSTSQGEIGFNSHCDYFLDVATFEHQIGDALAVPVHDFTAKTAEKLQLALALYKSDLLETVYDDWALRERERLRRLMLNGLAHLMRYFGRARDFAAAIDAGRRILDLDPLREEIHRELMSFYAANGQGTLLLQQYEQCRQLLQRELGIEPMADTRRLYEHLLGSLGYDSATPILEPPDTLPQAQRILNQALDALHTAQTQLQHALVLIDRAK